MRRSSRYDRQHAVSPVIGVIITVAICVVIAAVAYVWFSSFTEETGKKVVEPLSVSPDLNIERITGELGLQVVVGKRINWDNYKVMLNGSRVYTTAGKESFEGETVFFDYLGGRLRENQWYDLDIIDERAQMVVYSDRIPAQAYPPEGTGVYGYITSATYGYPLYRAQVYLIQNDRVVNHTESDPTGAFIFFSGPGIYELRVEVNGSLPETFGRVFWPHTAGITIQELRMIKYDIALRPGEIENSTLMGTIYDAETNTTLADVNVRVTDFRFFQKLHITDTSGSYEFSMPARQLTVLCTAGGYRDYIMEVNLTFNETQVLDIFMKRLPEASVTIKGHVYDKTSGEPLSRVNVFADGAYDTPFVKTDENGYYELSVIPGNVTVFVDTVDYKYYEKKLDVESGKSYTVDIYLQTE